VKTKLNDYRLCWGILKMSLFGTKGSWDEIQSKIKFDQAFGENQAQGLWALLGDFKDVFVWHKGELGVLHDRGTYN
jgi:hypothetical protein